MLKKHTCPRCQRANQCAVAADEDPASCWCMQKKPVGDKLVNKTSTNTCYCANCLQELTQELSQEEYNDNNQQA